MGRILGIAAFDLDGTLLRGPTICEVLAEPLGRGNEMRRFETWTSQDEIAAARCEMANWYAGHSLPELEAHLENVRWASGAAEGIAQLRAAGVEVAILSVTWGFAVRSLAQQLGVDQCLGTELLPDGEISHCWGNNKADFLKSLMASRNIPRNRVAAIGDSASDLPMLECAGLRFFVGAVAPKLENVFHLPDGDIRSIANQILANWRGV